jgi:hypothetical protein
MPGFQPARTPEEIDRRIELWHTMSDEEFEALGQPGLNDYLDWHLAEYDTWLMTGIIPQGG